MLAAALFLLGYGWNLTFVGGSTLLAQAMTAAERLAVQGAVDAWVWGTSALASIVAGILLSVTSFAALAVVAGLVSVVPLPLLTHTRTADRVRDSMAG
jgi:MFS family permease